jgi:hypothetical protein
VVPIKTIRLRIYLSRPDRRKVAKAIDRALREWCTVRGKCGGPITSVAPLNFGGTVKLPNVAVRIREIAELIQEDHPDESGELFELAAEIKRRSSPRAPASSTKMTRELTRKSRSSSRPTRACRNKR